MEQTRLDAIRARCEAATKGPWELTKDGRYEDHDECRINLPNDTIELCSYENGEFIAHARTDVPDLLAEVEKLREQLEYADLVLDAYKQDRDEWRRRAEKAEACIPKMLQLMPIGLCKRLCKRAGVNCGTYGDCNPEWCCVSGRSWRCIRKWRILYGEIRASTNASRFIQR